MGFLNQQKYMSYFNTEDFLNHLKTQPEVKPRTDYDKLHISYKLYSCETLAILTSISLYIPTESQGLFFLSFK